MQKRVSAPKPSPKDHRSGYTLAEMMVVLVIIALIVAIVGPRIFGQVGKAKAKVARVQVENLASAVEYFYLDMGHYPSTSEGLQALVQAPADSEDWQGPYLRKGKVPMDPWNHPYQYTREANGRFSITSLGQDNKPGGTGEDQDYTFRN